MNRRGFLKSILAAGVAPAFVGSSILMPVKALARVEWELIEIDASDVLSASEWSWTQKSFYEIVTETLRARQDELTANVQNNNALLRRLLER